jgi:hypothetical protein
MGHSVFLQLNIRSREIYHFSGLCCCFLFVLSTETFYEISMTNVPSIHDRYKDMGFSSKSTSFEPKTSEQMKNRHVSKLYP